jgi:carbon storage regulator
MMRTVILKPQYIEFPPGWKPKRVFMLVVTRKKDEKLIIGNEIEIQVLRIGRDNVRLGIKAPAHISIYRYEIYEAIKNENVSAVTSQIPDKDTLDKLSKGMKVE